MRWSAYTEPGFLCSIIFPAKTMKLTLQWVHNEKTEVYTVCVCYLGPGLREEGVLDEDTFSTQFSSFSSSIFIKLLASREPASTSLVTLGKQNTHITRWITSHRITSHQNCIRKVTLKMFLISRAHNGPVLVLILLCKNFIPYTYNYFYQK